jgi:hypothetical protein
MDRHSTRRQRQFFRHPIRSPGCCPALGILPG